MTKKTAPARYSIDNGPRRAYALKAEANDLATAMTKLSETLAEASYQKGFNQGFDYAATGEPETATDPETGATTRTLHPATGNAA